MIYDNTWRIVNLAQLREAVQGKRVFIFGNSRSNDKIFALALGQGVAGIFDNNPSQQGKKANGIPIVAPYYADDIVILTVLADREHLWPQLRQLGYRQWFYIPAPTSRFTQKQQKVAEFLVSTKSDFIPHGHFRYVHIIPDQKFFRPVLYLLKHGFDIHEHLFVVCYFGESNPLDGYHLWNLYDEIACQYHNVILFDGVFGYDSLFYEREKTFRQALTVCERIILHGEQFSPFMCGYLHKRIGLLKEKGIIIPWSGTFGFNDFTKENIKQVVRHCRVINFPNDDETFKLLIQKDILDSDIKRAEFLHVDYSVPFRRPIKKKNKLPRTFMLSYL